MNSEFGTHLILLWEVIPTEWSYCSEWIIV